MSFEYLTLDEQVRHEAEQKGINKGLKQGIKQGKEEGILEHAQETYNRMVKDGFTPEQARKYAYGS